MNVRSHRRGRGGCLRVGRRSTAERQESARQFLGLARDGQVRLSAADAVSCVRLDATDDIRPWERANATSSFVAGGESMISSCPPPVINVGALVLSTGRRPNGTAF